MLRIVALGDSTTAGTPGFLSPLEAPPNGAGNEKSQYPYWMMREHPDWKVLNRGINGERTDQILARFQKDVVEERPEMVIVLGGVNDVYQGLPARFATRNLLGMYLQASLASVVPIACTVLPYNTMGNKEGTVRRELNSWVKTTSEEMKIPFCDTAQAAADRQNPDRLSGSPDGLHPDVNGYKQMAGAISKVVEEIISSRDPRGRN